MKLVQSSASVADADYETLSALRKADPAEFETCARRLIDTFIESSPEHLRENLWRFQMALEMKIVLATHGPFGLYASELLVESFDRAKAEYVHDRLAQFYREDPEVFDRRARQLIDAVTAASIRLRRMQYHIDRRLGSIKDPMARFNEMIRMFYVGLEAFLGAFHGEFPSIRDGKVVTLPAH